MHAEVGETLEVKIAARPIDGEANAELLRFLGEDVLGVKKSVISLDRGDKSRAKTVVLRGLSSLNVVDVLAKLRAAVGKR